MCLFFGDFESECDHSQCQIVRTIKNLNEQSLFNQSLSKIDRQQRSERISQPVSIQNFVQEDQKNFKVQERDDIDECEIPNRQEFYQQKVVMLEKQLFDLKRLTYEMKAQLESRGLLSF